MIIQNKIDKVINSCENYGQIAMARQWCEMLVDRKIENINVYNFYKNYIKDAINKKLLDSI